MSYIRPLTIKVRGLARQIREQDLKQLFQHYGYVTRIDLRRGYALIEYEDGRNAITAIRALNDTDFQNCRLRVEFALENVRSEYRVLVDNLPSDAGWTELKNHIVKILQMKSSRDLFGHIYRDMDGRSLGYGFVEFGSFEEMKSAIRKLNNTEFFGRGLRFREDTEHPYPESDSKSKSSKRYQPYSPYDRKQKEDYREREKSDRYRDSRDYRDSYAPKGSHDRISREERDTSRDHHHVLNPEGLTSLFVGGVDNDIDEVQFRKCFDKFGTIVDIKLLRGKRCGFVQYAEHKEALKAVNEMNGALVGRYRIRVQWRVRKPAHIVAAEKSRLEALKRMNESQSERRTEQSKEQTNGKCANQV